MNFSMEELRTKFTIDEKRIIVAILVAVMEADGIIDPREMRYLGEVLDAMGLPESVVESIEDWDMSLVYRYFREMPADKQEEAKRLFVGMAESDEVSDPRELDIIDQL